MTFTTSKSVLICVIWATALVVAGRAQGQTGGAIGTGTGGVAGTAALAASDFNIHFESYSNGKWVQMSWTTQQYFFNQARCLCDTDPAGEFRVVVQPGSGAAQKIQTLLMSNLAEGGQGASYLFASTQGYDCLNPTAYVGGLGALCTNLIAPDSGYPGITFSSMAAFASAPSVTSGPIPVAYLFNALSAPTTCGYTGTCDSAALCGTTNAQTNLQFWAQTSSGIVPDFDPGPAAAVNLVGNVSVTPTDVTAEGGNEALKVSWDWGGVNIAADPTISGVQIFCQRGADTPIFPSGTYAPVYMTPATLCPNNPAATAMTGGPFSNFDPKYLCSGLIPAASTSYRITGLQNGIPYSVGVAAVDKYGNIGALTNLVYATPGAVMGGTGGTLGAGGVAGSADAGTGVRLGNGCSCDIRGKHDRSETAGILWLAAMTLAFALRRCGRVRDGHVLTPARAGQWQGRRQRISA